MEGTKHPKQDFQVERLAFFSDAIFAVALTLLIIDFKVPPLTKDSTYQSVCDQLIGYWPNLFAFLLSFVLISLYWMRHHFFFKYIHNYNSRIVIMNIAMLLPIIFLPFTTSFVAQSSVFSGTVFVLAFQVYSLNQILILLTMLAFFVLVFVIHKNHTYEIPIKERIKFVINNVNVIVIFSIIFIASFYTINVFKYAYIIVLVSIPIKRITERYFLKRYKKKPDSQVESIQYSNPN